MASASGIVTLKNIERVTPEGVEKQTVKVEISNLPEDHTFDCKGLRMYPALWNAHEHLDFNLFPHLGNPPYKNAYDWGLEITEEKREPVIDAIMRVPDRVRFFYGALKNILSATTTVLHHGETSRVLFKLFFPITVIPKHSSPHSLRFEENLKKKFSEGDLWSIHVAEGTDREARMELETLNDMGYLDETTAIVHGVGLRQSDIRRLKKSGAPFIWCPSSNEFLFQKHAPIGMIQRAEIPVMLGTDSTLTGSDGMLSEIRLAAQQVDDPKFIFEAATQTLRKWSEDVVPEPHEGFFIVKKKTKDPFADFVTTERKDILMLVDGDQMDIVAEQFEAARPPLSTCLLVDGAKKHVAGEWAPYIATIVNALDASFVPGIELCPVSAS